MGMTYEEFWCGPAELVAYYRKADKLRLSRENQMLWLQGGYFYDALCAALARGLGGNRGAKYMDEPMPLVHEQEENRERERQKAIAFFNAFRDSHAKSKGGGVNVL